MLAIMVLATGAAACSDNDKFDDIQTDRLPEAAKAFVRHHFSGEQLRYSSYDPKDDEYEVHFKSGAEIEFFGDGTWKDVKAAAGKSIPMDILPPNMADYIILEYSPAYPVEVSREKNGYEVELSDDRDLYFDKDGVFRYEER